MIGPPNMAATVRRFSYPVSRWRYAAAASVTATGWMVSGAPVQSAIIAHVTPAPGKVIEQLPEGHEGKRTVVVYTADELRVADIEAQLRGDLVEHDGAVFEVIKRGAWTMGAAGATTWRDHVAVQVFDRLPPPEAEP